MRSTLPDDPMSWILFATFSASIRRIFRQKYHSNDLQSTRFQPVTFRDPIFEKSKSAKIAMKFFKKAVVCDLPVGEREQRTAHVEGLRKICWYGSPLGTYRQN